MSDYDPEQESGVHDANHDPRDKLIHRLGEANTELDKKVQQLK